MFTLIILCILGGIFWTETLIHKQNQITEPDETERDLPIEELPEKGFQELKVTYFGDDQQYRMDTAMESIVQKSDGDLNFFEMEAKLFQGDELVREFISPEGWMLHQDGVVQLKGPIHLQTKEYQLSTKKMFVNLNQGTFQTKGQVLIQSENMTVEAQEMHSDFNLDKIHLTGRPRLTVKKGG